VGRRGFREDAIYFDYSGGCHAAQHHRGCLDCGAARCRWATGADGKRVRRKVFGRTRQDVKDKLDGLHSDLDAGIRRPGSRYPVATHSTRTVAVIHNALERLCPPQRSPIRQFVPCLTGVLSLTLDWALSLTLRHLEGDVRCDSSDGGFMSGVLGAP
jgi:hypothetical protein